MKNKMGTYDAEWLCFFVCEIHLTEIDLSNVKAFMAYQSCIEWKTIVEGKRSANSFPIHKLIGALVRHTYRYQPLGVRNQYSFLENLWRRFEVFIQIVWLAERDKDLPCLSQATIRIE